MAVHGASIDMWNGFYQLKNRDLGDWFGIDGPHAASYWDVASVYDPEQRAEVPVRRDEVIFPVFEGMAMGWSWALYFCNEIFSNEWTAPGTVFRPRQAAFPFTDDGACGSGALR